MKKCQCTFSINSKQTQSKEEQRLKEIMEYNLSEFDIKDQGLQMITNLAAKLCNTKLSLVTLVGGDYVDILSRVGCDWTGVPRKDSLCNLIVQQDEFFEVPDALLDIRTKDFPVVQYPTSVRFCAGYPIKNPNGFNLGNLVVVDFVPNKLNDFQILALKTLAEQVIVHLELRKQNHKLKLALEKEAKLSRAKDDFVSNMSHELRTPLNAAIGYIDYLNKTELNSFQKEAVEIIKSSCTLIVTLINDILDISKIESGQVSLSISHLDVEKTLSDIKNLLMKKAEENFNALKIYYDPCIPRNLIGDVMRIQQILINLTENSIKFTKNGKIKVGVKLVEDYGSQVKLKFSVKDSGIGIPSEKLGIIFERFRQADKETSVKYGGTGLGLSISKELVQLFGGKLMVKSKQGEGSKFFFEIILEKSKVCENVETEKNLKMYRILICEDNIVNIRLFKHIFKEYENNIDFAENGKIAIEKLIKFKNFDAILMDINMPEMNGIETTKYIRRKLCLNLPIIGFTANDSISEKEICIENGMNDYVSKTFISTELFKVIMENIYKYKNGEFINSKNVEIKTYNNFSKLNEFSFQSLKEKDILLDIKSLKEYSSNDFSFEKEFLSLFMKEFQDYLKFLKTAIEEENKEKIGFIVHKMKSPLQILNLEKFVENLNLLKDRNINFDGNIIEIYKLIKRDFKNLSKNICNYLNV